MSVVRINQRTKRAKQDILSNLSLEQQLLFV